MTTKRKTVKRKSPKYTPIVEYACWNGEFADFEDECIEDGQLKNAARFIDLDSAKQWFKESGDDFGIIVKVTFQPVMEVDLPEQPAVIFTKV